ncbi:MAG: hypothetical protein DBY37_11075 [Desulfovibrionaceae bacterium]|nr:MAG: hypothetical protein DBY37_15595 [Desulfovibrionaceae bacterium]PWL58766.1 MAG: hypothetical protein DBY37_11075 [Desulfovibrionaceae bacterium]
MKPAGRTWSLAGGDFQSQHIPEPVSPANAGSGQAARGRAGEQAGRGGHAGTDAPPGFTRVSIAAGPFREACNVPA